MMRLVVLVLVLMIVSTLAVGCGRSRKTTYSTPGGKVTVTSGNLPLDKEKTVAVETKEGKAEVTAGTEKTITEAELGAPVYPGAKSNFEGKYQSSKPGQGGNVQQHMLSTPDDFDKVVAFYKSHLKNIKNEQSMSTGDSKMAIFQTGEGKNQLVVHVARNPKENRTMIQVIKGQ